jgi:hypothetical protein
MTNENKWYPPIIDLFEINIENRQVFFAIKNFESNNIIISNYSQLRSVSDYTYKSDLSCQRFHYNKKTEQHLLNIKIKIKKS